MAIFKYLIICLLGVGWCVGNLKVSAEPLHAGFLYDDFTLTLASGHRTEILGPGYYSEFQESQHTWAIPPLTLSHTEDDVTESEEWDFAYPVLTYDRFGKEYRWQFFQLFSFAGGRDQDTTANHRFTLFPIYFQQRSTDPAQNYTAVFPFYGELKHRLFRDQIDFVMFPFYSKTRKKDIVTRNMPYPVFHLREGDGLKGWQVWPFAGREQKTLTTITNNQGELLPSGGHDSLFINWPFYFKSTNGIGTTNVITQDALVPFYSIYHSKPRDSISYGWPIGVTRTEDREKKYVETDAPWPFIEFAHGEGKSEQRVWPFYSHATNTLWDEKQQVSHLEGDWVCWPIYKYNHVISPPLDRKRTRICFFLYSHVNLKDTESGRNFQRTDFWPFYTHRKELNGNERLQVLAILEPVFPNNKSLARDYSPLYSFWRAEKNPKTGSASQSLLWNLYRHETTPQAKKISLLFGLLQYESTLAGKHWRVCYLPVHKTAPKWPEPAPVVKH